MNRHEYSCSWINLLESFFGPLWEWSYVFIDSMRFLLCSFVSRSFLVLLRYLIFLIHVCMFNGVRFQASQDFKFPFLRAFWCCSIFIINTVHFSLSNSILISWIYILTVSVRVSNSSSFFENYLVSSMYIRFFFLAIYKDCVLQSISYAFEWAASLQLQIVMVIAHLPGR